MSAAGMLALMFPGVAQAGHNDSNILLERSWGIQRNSAQLHEHFQNEIRYARYGNQSDQQALLRAMCALTDESKRLSSDLQCSTPFSKLNDRVSMVNRYLRDVNRLSGCVQLSPCVRDYLRQTNSASSNFNQCFSANGRSYASNKGYQPVNNSHNHGYGNHNDRNRDYRSNDRDYRSNDRDYRSNDRDKYSDRHKDYGRRDNDRDGEGFYRMRATKAQKLPGIIIDRRSNY